MNGTGKKTEILRKTAALLLGVILLLSLCACGSNASGRTEQYSMKTSAPASAYGAYYADAAEEAMADYDGEFGLAMSASNTSARGTSKSGDTPEENPDKIIYSSDVTVETTAFDETVAKVGSLVETYGGWIESSSVSGSNYYQAARGNASARSASYTLRIPSARFTELMEALTELGNIPYSHIYTENVTSQYYDAQAHLKAYTTQENRLLEMMELAESVEDVIIIEDRLTELRYQIEALQSRLNNWDRRVSYSTVSLSVQEVREYTPEEKINPTYGEELAAALKNGLENAGQFLKDLLVFLVEVIPVLLILVPIVWLIVWLLRRAIRKLRQRKAAKKAARTEGKSSAKPEKMKTEDNT